MGNYVYSTLSCDNSYTNYRSNHSNDMPVVHERVLIKGGANIATKLFGTPAGVMTSVSDNELEILEKNPVFQTHKDKGFITVRKSQVDVERAASDMEAKDSSAPVVPQDLELLDDGKPETARIAARNGGKLKAIV